MSAQSGPVSDSRRRLRRRNRIVLGSLVAVVVAMNGFAYAMVPAYRAFCQQFGFAGTPLVAAEAPAAETVLADRNMTIRFNSDVATDLDWRFKPEKPSVAMKIGETALVNFVATNLHPDTVTGTATFNVTPLKAAPYFVKIECFCFTKQTLIPGETALMPVTFFVDPEIANDRNLDDVDTITLSYTFFRDRNAAADKVSARPAVQTKSGIAFGPSLASVER